MVKKHSLILDDEFIQYCKLNDIDDIDKLAKETFQKGFTLLKYGEIPEIQKTKVEKQKKSQKEMITEVKPPIKDKVTRTQKKPITHTENDLYDE